MILEFDDITKGYPGWDLGDINDVLITSASNAQVLQYQSSSGKWINATIAGTGDVVGPSSSTNGNLVLFNGTTGKLIKDGGTVTAAGLALLDDATAADQRTTLGLGGAAVLNVGTTAGTVCAGDDGRLSDARTPTAHVLDSASHTVSGLTTGHFLKATGATTFGFAAHGLTYSDVGAVQAITSTANRLARFASTTGQISDSSMREDASGNVTVTGNLTVQGQSFQADHKILTGDTFILINHGETGAGVTNLRAGLDIDRGTLYPYRFQMHETTDDLRIGQYYVSLPYTGLTGTFQAREKVTGGTSGAIGWIITDNGTTTMTLRGTATAFTDGETITGETSLATATAGTQVITDNTQAVATREDVPTSAGVAYWNAVASRMDTMTGITATATAMTVGATGTLNVSAGTLTLADNQIAWAKVSKTGALPINVGAQALNGFVDRTNSTLAMSGSDFQITTGTSYEIWSAGTKYTKSTTQQVAISNDLTLHYVYFDTAGTLQVATSAWDIVSDNIPAAIVYKDGSNYLIWDERHGYKRDRDWHEWAHDTIGARYESGFVGTFGNSSLSITRGYFHDEDIEIDSGATKTTCNILYRNTGLTAMRVELAASVPYKAITGALQFDSAGTITPVTASRYVCNYVYATNDITNPIYVVVGQNQHVNLANARAESLPSILMGTAEWKLLYRVIYQNAGGTATYVETADYRTVSSLPGGSVTSINAASVTYVPGGNLSATNVQAAIDELDAEKVALTPGSSTQNIIQPSGDFKNVILKAYSSQTENLLEFQNSSGTAIASVNISGYLMSPDGAAATPSITFINDTNTGLYSYGADQIGFATAGVVKLAIKTTGIFTDRFATASDTNTIIGISAAGAGNLAHSSADQGWHNVLIGNSAGYGNTTGYGNVCVGREAGYSTTTSNVNTFIGDQTGRGCTGSSNTMIGNRAGYTTNSASHNVFIGETAGYRATGGSNIGIGRSALDRCIGTGSVAIGYQAASQSTASTNEGTVCIGYQCLKDITTGANYNTAVGYQSGLSISSGANNVLVGYKSGDNLTTGSGNIIIGYDLDASAVGVSNELNIGGTIKGNMTGTTTTAQVYFPDGAVDTPSISFQSDTNTGLYWVSADKVAIATGGVQRMIFNDAGKVGIGIASPTAGLHIAGNGLKVAGSPTGYTDELAFTSAGAGATVAISSQATTTASMYFDHRGTDNTGGFLFRNGTGGATTLMTITGAGSVGIGTSSPSAKLAINGGLHIGGDSDPGDNNCTVDGEMLAATIATNASYSWTLGGYTAGAPTVEGYLTVTVEGATYRIAVEQV